MHRTAVTSCQHLVAPPGSKATAWPGLVHSVMRVMIGADFRFPVDFALEQFHVQVFFDSGRAHV